MLTKLNKKNSMREWNYELMQAFAVVEFAPQGPWWKSYSLTNHVRVLFILQGLIYIYIFKFVGLRCKSLGINLWISKPFRVN